MLKKVKLFFKENSMPLMFGLLIMLLVLSLFSSYLLLRNFKESAVDISVVDTNLPVEYLDANNGQLSLNVVLTSSDTGFEEDLSLQPTEDTNVGNEVVEEEEPVSDPEPDFPEAEPTQDFLVPETGINQNYKAALSLVPVLLLLFGVRAFVKRKV